MDSQKAFDLVLAICKSVRETWDAHLQIQTALQVIKKEMFESGMEAEITETPEAEPEAETKSAKKSPKT